MGDRETTGGAAMPPGSVDGTALGAGSAGGPISELGGEGAGSATDQAKETAAQAVHTAKEKAGQVAEQASTTADAGIGKAATGLGKAAAMLREKSQAAGGQGVQSVATTAADKLDGAARYLRDKDGQQLVTDLEGLVRRKPTESLLVAAGVGFLLSKVLR